MLYHCYRNRCTIVTENDASLLLILMYSILPKMMYFSLPITGRSYAIPTMFHGRIDDIAPYIDEFIKYAKNHPEQKFLVTKIGCGVAGFKPSDIAPLFMPAAYLINVYLPAEFWLYIQQP